MIKNKSIIYMIYIKYVIKLVSARKMNVIVLSIYITYIRYM